MKHIVHFATGETRYLTLTGLYRKDNVRIIAGMECKYHHKKTNNNLFNVNFLLLAKRTWMLWFKIKMRALIHAGNLL